MPPHDTRTPTHPYDLTRPATTAQRDLARELRCPNPSWIACWNEAGFTDEDIRAWFPVTRTGLNTFVHEWAARLRAAGWTPEQVKAAQDGHSLHIDWTQDHDAPPTAIGPLAPPRGDPADLEATKATLVLAQYLYLRAEQRLKHHAAIREDLLVHLADHGTPDTTSAALTDLSKQRIGAILKPRRSTLGILGASRPRR